MDGNEIGNFEQAIEAHALNTGRANRVLRHVRIVRDHTQPKCLGLRRQRARNVAETNETEHAAGEPVDRNQRRHLPAARLDERVRVGNFARQREQERHGVIGDLLHAIVRHIGHGDAALGGGRNVDVVDAEAETADGLAARQLPQQIAR